MNAPAELQQLRTRIDTIDQEIMQLLMDRLSAAKRIGELKTNLADPMLMIRPGREATLLRRLISTHQDQYNPQAIHHIWRAIISTSVYTEHPIHLAIWLPTADQTPYWLAREYFGSFVSFTIDSDLDAVFHQIQQSEHTIGVIGAPTHTSWWCRLASESLYIFARLRPPYSPDGPVYAIHSNPPESSGQDESLWVISTPHSELHDPLINQIQSIDGTCLAQDSQDYLIQLTGDYTQTQSNLRMVSNLDDAIETYHIGTYAVL